MYRNLVKGETSGQANPADFKIKHIRALEILDSRGNPTVRVQVELANGVKGVASVPSGASTGEREALELRDGDSKRFGGNGVTKAVNNIHNKISKALEGMDAREQKQIDQAMKTLDGTDNKSELGANAMLGVSLAVAHAAANAKGVPLHEHISDVYTKERKLDENGQAIKDPQKLAAIEATKKGVTMPTPMMNVINGGAHASNSLDFQEIMIVPTKATSIAEATRMGAEVFQELKGILKKSGKPTQVGDEGGFAPDFKDTKEALETVNAAIKKAGHEGKIAIALDVAASELVEKKLDPKTGKPLIDEKGNHIPVINDDGTYNYILKGEGKKFNSHEMVEYLKGLKKEYNIVSIEDGLGENDKIGWKKLTDEIKHNTQLVGDDYFVTDPKQIKEEGIKKGIANSVLIKVNQIGTLSETLDAIKTAQVGGYTTVISHRSGETADTTIADIAVGTNAGQIKTGSLSRSDRTEKYNRLMEIEAWELGKLKSRNPNKEDMPLSMYAGEKGFNVSELKKAVSDFIAETSKALKDTANWVIPQSGKGRA